MRKFHINQLPQDRIFILLEEGFHRTLFKELKENFSFEELNKLMENKLKWSTYKKWFYRLKRNKISKNPRFIPLWFFIKVSKILPEFNIKIIESNIIAYKGPSASTTILNPEFPLKRDNRMLRLVAHLTGDGHIDGAFGTNLPKGKSSSYYANTSLDLVKSSQNDLKIFGNFKTNINKEHRSVHQIYRILIPSSIGYILSHIYNINFDCFNSRVPESLYRLNKNQIKDFIRAYADDEAHVYDNSIEFYSSNKILIEDFIKLIKLKFPELNISKIKINKKSRKNAINPKYSFSILSESLKFYAKNIGFDHEQKIKDLLFNIKRNKLDNKHNQSLNTSEKILKRLSKENLTAKNLSRKLFLTHGYLLKRLNKLEKENKIRAIRKEKFSNVWGLKTLSYQDVLGDLSN